MRSNAAEGPRDHEVLIGVGTNDRDQGVKVGAVISALGRPHDLIKSAFDDLGQADATRITTFTDGDRILGEYLTKAGVAAAPILDWQHPSAASKSPRQPPKVLAA